MAQVLFGAAPADREQHLEQLASARWVFEHLLPDVLALGIARAFAPKE